MSKVIFNSESNPSEDKIILRSRQIKETTRSCSDRCSFTFSYGLSTCSIKNKGAGHFELSYDSSVSNVLFNGVKYNVYKVHLHILPVHQYYGSSGQSGTGTNVNGNEIIGELLIEHKAESYGDDLLVCVPVIMTSGDQHSVLDEALLNSSTERNTQQTVLVENYSLGNFIPEKPYFYYYDTSPIGKSRNNKVHCIVCDPKQFTPVGINWNKHGEKFMPLLGVSPYNTNTRSETEKWLNNRNNAFALSTVDPNSSTRIFYNESGPSKSAGENDIYIDCKPTGEGDSSIQVENQKTILNKVPGASALQKIFQTKDGKIPTKEEILNHKWFSVGFALVAFFVIWKGWTMIGDKITGKKPGAGAAAAIAKATKTTVTGKNL